MQYCNTIAIPWYVCMCTRSRVLAAHVLSSASRPHARTLEGVVVQSVPMANAHVQDERFRHILRLRFGVPCVTPLADLKCDCRGHGGPRHSDWVERASEGNRRDAALQQWYMLAQIAEEMHAPDRAAQDTGEGGNRLSGPGSLRAQLRAKCS